jgi:hypothetical protein
MERISQEVTHPDDTIETRQDNLIASVVHFLTEATQQCVSMQNRVDQYR